MKRITVIVFLAIICTPLLLYAARGFTGMSFDVPLDGYNVGTAEVKPALTAEGFFGGHFQAMYTQRTDATLPLRGVLTRTYNSMRYGAFHLGNRPIGKDGTVYEPIYLEAELGMGSYDFSIVSNRQGIDELVEHLVSVNAKLERLGKPLYIFIAPNKAGVYREEIPGAYLAKASDTAVNVCDYFRSRIKNTGIPVFFCEELLDELPCVAFYPTGIHWSRPFEQMASRRVIADIAELTGQKYRNLSLLELKQQSTPFWRDTDVHDLLNIWAKPKNPVFYQYESEAEKTNGYEPMELFVYGDSFSQGLFKDVTENFPEDVIHLVLRRDEVINSDGDDLWLSNGFDDVDFQRYLSSADAVVLGMVEVGLLNNDYALDFFRHLDQYLDTHQGTDYYLQGLDGDSDEKWDTSKMTGVYEKENGFAWADDHMALTLRNKDISDKGLEIVYEVPRESMTDGAEHVVTVLVNGKEVSNRTYTSETSEKLRISSAEFGLSSDHTYYIEIVSSRYFVPKELGINDDTRKLAIRLVYIGGQR